MKLSLNKKMLLIGLTGTFILSIITIIIAINNRNNQNAKAIEKFMNDTTYSLDKSISAQFFERYGDVQAFAINSILQTKNLKKITENLNNYAKMYGIYDVILFVDTNGKFIASNDTSPNGDKLNISKIKDKDFSNETWFQNSISEKYTVDKNNGFDGTYFEDAHFDPIVENVYEKKILTTSFSTVVKNQDGIKIGVITNRANFFWVGDEIKYTFNIINQQDLEVLIVNKQGNIIVNYNPSLNSNNKDIDYLFRSRKSTDFMMRPPFKEINSSKENVMEYFDSELNKDLIYAYKIVNNKKFIPDISWKVVFTIPSNKLFGTTNKNTLILIGTVLFILILSSIAVNFFSNKISLVFSGVAEKLRNTATSLLNSAQQLRKASETVSNNAGQQSDALQQISASLSEILSMASRTIENINESNKLSSFITQDVKKGNDSMIKLSSAIAKIEETNTLLFEMQEIIKNISNKTNVINGIVTKTELLSLNASIEAARAGEFGKGFAVVAEEVGDLAKTSGIAAKDIENLIAESVQKMNFIIEDIKSKISDGVVSQKESSGIFNKIATNIEEMSYKSISNQEAMDEQKIGIENTTTATNSLSQTTHANTEASKSALIASEKVENDSKNIYQNIIEIESLLYGK